MMSLPVMRAIRVFYIRGLNFWFSDFLLTMVVEFSSSVLTLNGILLSIRVRARNHEFLPNHYNRPKGRFF